jgi:hypothetical protein
MKNPLNAAAISRWSGMGVLKAVFGGTKWRW